MTKSSLFASLALAALVPLAGGCTSGDAPERARVAASGETHGADQPKSVGPGASTAAPTHSHSGWWCDEHGVPEAECALCNSKLAADFQRKGDWCEEHDRPDSQCFVCHPELEARFAAKYEAKYGVKPPKPQG